MMIPRDLQRTLAHSEQLALFAVKHAAGVDSPEWRAARERLILTNRPLAIRATRRYVGLNLGFTLDDLISAGVLGVIVAVDGFDPGRGVRFSTYAAPPIRRAIQDEIIRSAGLVRVPYQHHPVVAAANGLHDDPAVLAALGSLAIGLVGADVDPFTDLMRSGAEVGDEGGLRHGLEEIIARVLPPVAAGVLRARLLAGGPDQPHYSRLGQDHGFSQQQAYQIYREALEKIRPHVARYLQDGTLPTADGRIATVPKRLGRVAS